MAGVKIDNFSTSDVNLTAIMDTLQATRQGHFRLSLTEIDTTTEPEIAAGSIIDLNGSLIYFDADESIGGTASDGVVYVKLIYSSGTVTAEYTSTAPAFDTSKNGWYGTGANSGHRYIAKMIKADTAYTGKMYYDSANMPYSYEIQEAHFFGNWNNSETKTITLTYTNSVVGITFFSYQRIANFVGIIKSVVISGNTVVIQLYTYYTQQNAYYDIICGVATL